jgi:hypothetical protein
MKKAPDEEPIPLIGMLRHLSQLPGDLELTHLSQKSAQTPQGKAFVIWPE